jgi:hypothetical protein
MALRWPQSKFSSVPEKNLTSQNMRVSGTIETHPRTHIPDIITNVLLVQS